MTDIAILGNGNHSKRIQKILKKKNYDFIIYKPIGNLKIDKLNFSEVKKCKIIFVCSPNDTHFYYINELRNKYIFCEKPPVTSLKEIQQLKSLDCKKIYFNFNKRFSKISEVLKDIKNYNLGDLIYGNLICSHGLAFKKEYKSSWRADKSKAKKGVFEIVSIHDIDLINFHFNIMNKAKPILMNFSNVGNSSDTSLITVEVKNNAKVNIFSTYTSSLCEDWILMFKNGIIKLNNQFVRIYGPTNNFDNKGFFVEPKLINKISIKKNDYENSLNKSISYFLNICNKKKFFPKKLFDLSLKSNSFLF
jgi:predicted dehydrogenase